MTASEYRERTLYYKHELNKRSEERHALWEKQTQRKGIEKGVLGCLGLIFLFILIANVFSVVFGGEFKGLGSIFTLLTSVEPIPLDWLSIFEFNLGDWGAFNFLRDFIGIFGNLLQVVLFMATSIINALLYLMPFLRYMFSV